MISAAAAVALVPVAAAVPFAVPSYGPVSCLWGTYSVMWPKLKERVGAGRGASALRYVMAPTGPHPMPHHGRTRACDLDYHRLARHSLRFLRRQWDQLEHLAGARFGIRRGHALHEHL